MLPSRPGHASRLIGERAVIAVREPIGVQAGDLAACADLRRVVDTVWVEVEPDVAALRGAGQEVAVRCR